MGFIEIDTWPDVVGLIISVSALGFILYTLFHPPEA